MLSACARADPHRVHIFAATSLREPVEEIARAWEARQPGATLVLQLAASNVLADQILATRRADLFLSADREQLERVRAAGLVVADGPRPWLSNQLVVVVPARAAEPALRAAADLVGARFARLSLGNPESVPAGRYAKQWLEALGLWSTLAPRVVPAIDARAAVAAVENGACDAGVVYATDAALAPALHVALRIAPGDGPAIEYALAALAGPADPALARATLDAFASPAADAVFRRHGFLVPERR